MRAMREHTFHVQAAVQEMEPCNIRSVAGQTRVDRSPCAAQRAYRYFRTHRLSLSEAFFGSRRFLLDLGEDI